MPLIPRAKILEKFHTMIAAGKPIVGGGAGTGLSAKSEEAGGIDLIVIYNSGRYRMAGRGSAAGLLAYGNVGGPGRLDFTCIGAAVNLSARVESLAGALGRPVLVTEAFAAACPDAVVDLGEHPLKGVPDPTRVYEPRPAR